MNLFSLLKKYLHARSKWIAAGRPLRTDERIAEIWDNHCSNCDKREADRCTMCGCFIRREGVTLNKLAWGTEDCPVKKWQLEVLDIPNVELSEKDKLEIEELEEQERTKEFVPDEPKKTPHKISLVKQKENMGCCD